MKSRAGCTCSFPFSGWPGRIARSHPIDNYKPGPIKCQLGPAVVVSAPDSSSGIFLR